MIPLDFSKIPLRMALGAIVVALSLAACRSTPEKTPQPVEPAPVIVPPPAPLQPSPPVSTSSLRPAQWTDLPSWTQDEVAAAWGAFLTSCRALATQSAWHKVCVDADKISRPDNATARKFFELNFQPYQLVDEGGRTEGLATGYYEPLLRGSRTSKGNFRYPIYGTPDDLITIDLPAFGISDRGSRLKARVDNHRAVPYFDRAQIESGLAPVRGREIAWVDDPVELFFLQVQGSGRIELDDGSVMRVGFADHNGHPYRSIGRHLIDRGELTLERASMQGIKAWARKNPEKLREVLNHNPRYIFFRELPANLDGPLGSLGVPLTARRSIAVDPRHVPLGAPVFLATTWPLSNKPLNQLVMAQDTGSAIRGAVRADFFWGYGDAAGHEAGRMKQTLRMWLLLPHGFPLAAP